MGEIHCRGKNAWPELLGKDAQVAKRKVEAENPFVRAVILKQGSYVTFDYLCTRVRVWTNDAGNVVMIPRIG